MAESINIILRSKMRKAEELVRAQRLPEACAAYEQLCQQNPRDCDLWINFGVINAKLGKFDAAEAAFKKALALRNDDPHLYINLIRLCELQGRFDEAVGHCESYLRLKPNDGNAYAQKGKLLHMLGRLHEAEQALREALRCSPDNAAFFNNLGIVLYDLGRYDEALECYQAALRLNPSMDNVYCNLGNLYSKNGEDALIEESYIAAIRINPRNAEAHMNLGCHYHKIGQYDAAIRSFQAALRIAPDYADAYMNLGYHHLEIGEHSEAARCFEEALRIQPDHVKAQMNLGCLYLGVGRHDEAMRCFEEALRIDPDCAGAHWNRAFLSLLLGEFGVGWQEYEWRLRYDEVTRQDVVARYASKPVWDGSPLTSQILFVYVEQGLGDTLQFCRYLPLVRQRVERVVFECQPELYPLLSRSFEGIDFIEQQRDTLTPAVSYDLQIPLMSLPRLFGTVIETIPRTIPYLCDDLSLNEYWRQRIDSATFNIGLVWAGSQVHQLDRKRSLSLAAFAPFGTVQNVSFYSLQKGPAAAEAATPPAGMRLIDLSTELNDFATTAAIVANLDLVITVDTSVAHLAGAMGKPVWVLIYSPPDWRWLLDRDDSPWYPTMRLFRQTVPGEWGAVIERVVEELQQECSGSGQQHHLGSN